MSKGKILCAQLKTVLLKVYDYVGKLELVPEVHTPPSNNRNQEEKFLQSFISSEDGPAKVAEIRQGRKHARRLPYYKTLVEEDYPTSTACTADVG